MRWLAQKRTARKRSFRRPPVRRSSVLRDGGHAPTVVETDFPYVDVRVRIGISEHNARWRRYRSAGAGITLPAAKVEIFALDAPVVAKGVFNACSDRIGKLRIGAAVDDQETRAAAGRTAADAVVGEAVIMIDKGGAPLDVEQSAIGRPAGAAGDDAV